MACDKLLIPAGHVKVSNIALPARWLRFLFFHEAHATTLPLQLQARCGRVTRMQEICPHCAERMYLETAAPHEHPRRPWWECPNGCKLDEDEARLRLEEEDPR